jgi:hypothetical protein
MQEPICFMMYYLLLLSCMWHVYVYLFYEHDLFPVIFMHEPICFISFKFYVYICLLLRVTKMKHTQKRML